MSCFGRRWVTVYVDGMRNDPPLLVSEQGPQLFTGQSEQAQCRLARLGERFSVQAERCRLSGTPFVPHRRADEIPETILRLVQQAEMDGQRQRQTQRQQAALNGCCCKPSGCAADRELVHFFGEV